VIPRARATRWGDGVGRSGVGRSGARRPTGPVEGSGPAGRWARVAGVDPRGFEHARRVALTKVAVSVFAVVMLVYLGLAVIGQLSMRSDGFGVLVVTVCSLLFAVTHLSIAGLAPSDLRLRLRGVALVAQAVLAVALPLWGGTVWLVLGAYLIGSVGIVFRPRTAAVAVAVVIAGEVALTTSMQLGWPETGLLLLRNVITGLCIAGGVRLGTLASDLFRTRDELAEVAVDVAVDEERLRFARELHDVLGHNLSAIALKSELTARLLEVRPELATVELGTIREIADRSLTDVRAVAKGYRRMDLRREADSVAAVLRSAGVACEWFEVPPGLPAELGDVLAWTLREGATNLLRHASPATVVVRCGRDEEHVWLEMRNDGVNGQLSRTDTVGGNGLAGLTERAAAVGGRVTTDGPNSGWFALTVRLPIDRESLSPSISENRTEQSGETSSVITSTHSEVPTTTSPVGRGASRR
jgi:two-component system sensor histidine kinase DesK